MHASKRRARESAASKTGWPAFNSSGFSHGDADSTAPSVLQMVLLTLVVPSWFRPWSVLGAFHT